MAVAALIQALLAKWLSGRVIADLPVYLGALCRKRLRNYEIYERPPRPYANNSANGSPVLSSCEFAILIGRPIGLIISFVQSTPINL